jgi:hypothetical protein
MNTETASTAPATTMNAHDDDHKHRCLNCGSVLLGDHCYQCGQPVKGLIRQFSSVIGDFFDTVFNLDSRTIRTIKPLLFKPGFLSNEYFEGRRVSYVTPLRLYIFFSVLAFFMIHASIEVGDSEFSGGPSISFGDKKNISQAGADINVGENDFSAAKTAEEVRKLAAEARAEIEQARAETKDVPGMGLVFDAAQKKINEAAEKRINELQPGDTTKQNTTEAKNSSVVSVASDDGEMQGINQDGVNFDVNNKPWHPKDNPVDFDWTPGFFDAWLNKKLARMDQVIKRGDADRTFVEAIFGALPQTMLLMLPLFAVLLKIVYLFKKRFYMEHLIVALHSHAFIALMLCFAVLFTWLENWAADFSGVLAGAFSWLIAACVIWIPLYLLIMQKRVYKQGWIMTLIKYFFVGNVYLFMLIFGIMFALLFGLLSV